MTMGPAPMIRMLWMSVLLGIAQIGKSGSGPRAVHSAFISPQAAHSAARIRRIRLSQSQLGLQASQHQMIEALEQRLQVVRAGTGFRVALEAECRLVFESEPLQGAVEQRAMRGSHAARQGRLINREAMILAGDEHPPGVQVLYGVIGTVVTELHFHGLRATSE